VTRKGKEERNKHREPREFGRDWSPGGKKRENERGVRKAIFSVGKNILILEGFGPRRESCDTGEARKTTERKERRKKDLRPKDEGVILRKDIVEHTRWGQGKNIGARRRRGRAAFPTRSE